MISERLWRERFGSDPNVLEETVRLGDPVGTAFSIIGVLPGSFMFPDGNVDVWFPHFTNFDLARGRNAGRYNIGIGRLRPGVTLEQALRYELDLSVILQTTRDREEGVRAFLEKRPPRFEGR
jgi:putative ABC transport system permease protein